MIDTAVAQAKDLGSRALAYVREAVAPSAYAYAA